MLSIITVYYNESFFIDTYLESLNKLGNLPFELILFNNYSDDKNLRKLRHSIDRIPKNLRRKIQLEVSTQNLGFAKAINESVKVTRYPLLLLLNPDTVANDKSIFALISTSKRERNCIVGGRFNNYVGGSINQKSAVNSASFKDCIFELTSLKKIPFMERSLNNFWVTNEKKTQLVTGVSGGFMLIPKKIFETFDGFDERFFLYLEDLDFCLRCVKEKIKIFYNPKAFVTHFSGGSHKLEDIKSNQGAWLHSRDYFFKKNFSYHQYLTYKIITNLERIYLKSRLRELRSKK